MTSAQQTLRAAKHWRAGQKAAKGHQWTSAAREFEQAVKFAPGDAGAWHDLAVSQMALDRLPDATTAAQRAFDLAPGDAVACTTLADCLLKQNRHSDAADVLAALAPKTTRTSDMLVTQATALFGAQRSAEAIPVFLQALSLDLTNTIAHFRMGLAFKDLQRQGDANLCFKTALATDTAGQARALILSQLVYGSRLSCEWEQLDEHTADLLAAIDTADDAIGAQLAPFTLLAIEATPQQQLRVGQLATKTLAQGLKPLPAAGPRKPGRIRVGYLSADFCNHATAILITELLERRDTDRFEVFLYSHSIEDGTPLQRRVRAAGDHYIDVSEMADLDVAKRMREDGIDIAVDLKGHTRDSRFRLLAHRPAPVQVAYLGYPATSGADFIDYLIGDAIVTPLEHAPNYSEKIAQLPDSYQPNDRHRVLPPAPSRAEEGLPEDAVVLCCFNQIYKVSPHMLDLWARILAGAPNTVLWMLTWTTHGHLNLSKELAARGVDLDRVFFAPKASVERHIARLRCADLFLDTWPCNAHTTASEALWAGVPVLTVPGATYASRVAASLVSACGLPEMACADDNAYVEAAIRLARVPGELKAAQTHLQTNRLSLPLFDTDRYARDYEALLARMFERQQAGLAPAHLPSDAKDVPPQADLREADAPVIACAALAPAAAASPNLPVELERPRGLTAATSVPASSRSTAPGGADLHAAETPPIHLVVMQPAGYLHALGFVDQARYLRHQLRRLGAQVTIGKNRLREDAINIVFGAHLGFPAESKERHTCLFFNLEQLGAGGATVTPAYMQLLRSSAVIDYDAGNVAAYRSDPLDVPIVPILHAPYLHEAAAPALEDRPIDLLFFGSLNTRRRALIERIEATGVQVTAFDHPVYGEERDQFIRQAKAVLNCHFYESSRLEQARVSHCLSLGTPVICERGPNTAPHPAFEDAVTWLGDKQWEGFFRQRFGKPAWFDAARSQLAGFSRHDPIDEYAGLLASALRVHEAQRQPADRGPWRPVQLNLGSGKDYKPGWLNLDVIDRAEPDLVLDIGQPIELPIVRTTRRGGPLRLEAGQLDRIYANNVLEHVPDLPMLMGNALALLKTGGEFEIEVPYERAVTAWQDPTHLRALNENSWLYYTDWFWYLGWFEERFELAHSSWLDMKLAPCQQATAAFMKVTLRKIVTSPRERTLARAMQAELRIPDDDAFDPVPRYRPHGAGPAATGASPLQATPVLAGD